MHPRIALKDLSEIMLQCYHTPMGVLKNSLLMGKLPFTYKSKGRQGIARVLLVSTIYNFNYTFCWSVCSHLEDINEFRGPKVCLLTKFILF